MSDHTMCPGCHQLRYWTDFDARCSQCRQPTPSSGAETESSPQCRCSMLSWSPLCERHGWLALIRRIQALEAGPPGLAGPPSGSLTTEEVLPGETLSTTTADGLDVDSMPMAMVTTSIPPRTRLSLQLELGLLGDAEPAWCSVDLSGAKR